MTDFLAWWADHWPLVPVLVLYPIFNAMLGRIVFGWLMDWATEKRRNEWGDIEPKKRRREP